MKKVWFVIAIAVLLLPLGLARAAEFASNSNGDIVVPTAESHHNFYTAGTNITVDAETTGDFAAAGSTVVVNGNVEQSLFAAGSTINIRGNVGNNVRVVGSSVTISGNIGGDLFVAGSTLTITKDAVINGGLYAAAANITIDGTVKGEARIAGSHLTVSGMTGRLIAYGDVTIKKTAIVNGDFSYHATQVATIENGAHITGATTFTQTAKSTNIIAPLLTLAALASLIGWILFGLLVAYLLPKKSQEVLDRVSTTPAAAIGYGLGVLIVLPVIAVALAVSIIGLPISFVLGLIWLLLLTFGSLFGRIVLGALIYRLFAKNQPLSVNWKTITIGVVASLLLGLIPIAGGLIKFIFFSLGMGAISQIAIPEDQRQSKIPVVPQ